jgi:hypothetical protein
LFEFFFSFFSGFWLGRREASKGGGGGERGKRREEKRRESEMERKEKVETGIDCCLEKSVR